MTQQELIKRLETTCFGLDPIDPLRLLVDDVIEALREHAMREVQRLGQEIEQEPVTTLEDLEQEIYENTRQFVSRDVMEWMLKRYYTTPPQRTWVGLTDEEIEDIVEDCDGVGWDVAQAIRAKLKQKNGFAEEKNT